MKKGNQITLQLICTLVPMVCLLSFSVQAQSRPDLLDQHHTLEIAPTSLIEALGLIRAESAVHFVYSPSSLPADQLVQISAIDRSLREVLEELFTPLDIVFEEIGGQIALRWLPKTHREAYTQTIRGRVVDLDTQTPLIGATVVVESMSPIRGASVGKDGFFEIRGLPVGRHTLIVQYIGFDPTRVSELLLTAGKEIVLDIALVAAPVSMDMLVVTDGPNPMSSINQTAVVSARSFSVEQTQRFAASITDPARMAQSFAGVSRSEDDLLNEVIVRGHSPKYTVWRLEGIEIPNPNHFGDDGHSSGGLNMLSANMLTNSDFFTGAFPAEYGNALAGVFDMNLRKGNSSRSEYTFGFGALGLESTLEGPFSKKYDGSYLINFRYSTLGLMTHLNIIEEDVVAYQDLSFKIHLPSREAGTFSLFGVGGTSLAEESSSKNTCLCSESTIRDDDEESEKKGIIGLNHQLVLSQHTYLKSTLAAFVKEEREGIYLIDPRLNSKKLYADEEYSAEHGFRGNVTLNHKLNPRHLLQMGFTGSLIWLNYAFKSRLDDPLGDWLYMINARDRVSILRGFGQWTYRYNQQWTLHAGIHTARFGLNKETTLEPRLGLKWQHTKDQSWSIGTGLHSQIEPFGIYLLEDTRAYKSNKTNRFLRLSKSWHNVLAFEKQYTKDAHFTAEIYYDHGFNIPVNDSLQSSFSVINSYFLYTVRYHTDGLVSKGTTTNYGVDLTLEKFFSRGYYFLITGSLFDARYTALAGNSYPSRYNTRYMMNVLGGIELKIGEQQKDVLSLNGSIVWGGGNRYSPINIVASGETKNVVIDPNAAFSRQLSPYFRLDIGVNYTMNKSYLTHSIYIDIQNIIHHKNQGFIEYDSRLNKTEITPQLGILPILGYRLTF